MNRLIKVEARTIFPVKVDEAVAICNYEQQILESMMDTYRIRA